MKNFIQLKEELLQKYSDNPQYLERINIELYEIEKAGLQEYFSGIVNDGRKFHNINNLLCAYLWDICPENPIDDNKELSWNISNELPDVDSDYTPEKRNDIKEFCSREFGEKNVVSIVNYNHFGIKSGLRNIARVMEVPLEDIGFTVTMEENMKKISWEQAIKMYPVLEEFEKKYPKVCELTRAFNGRVNGIGKHAAGVVIANCDLTKTVPLLTREDPDTGKKFVLSSFAEGQDKSDLKAIGLVKMDILGLENLNYISTCIKYMQENGKYDPKVGIFRSHPDDKDWTDESYLNDPECIKYANRGDLKLIFQFDSPGMRNLIKSGGVSAFDDLVNYTALYRPGGNSMMDEYIKRRNGKDKWESHPILDPILENTYGIIIFQEQLMQIMNKVGLISLQNCDDIRRAMSKKKEKDFIKYKDHFVNNGQRTLEWSKSKVEELWNQLITFAEYGFNRCITPDSVVETEDGFKLAGECNSGDLIKAYNPETGEEFLDEVIDIHHNGEEEVFEIELDNGYKIECTIEHEFVCEDGKKRKLKEIIKKNYKIICKDDI